MVPTVKAILSVLKLQEELEVNVGPAPAWDYCSTLRKQRVADTDAGGTHSIGNMVKRSSFSLSSGSSSTADCAPLLGVLLLLDASETLKLEKLEAAVLPTQLCLC